LHALVLDEADQMLDMGFVNDVKKIVLTPKNRQTLFSLQCQLRFGNWLKCFNKSRNSDRIPVFTAENVEQHVYFVEKPKKKFIISLNQESRPV
jgi:ATP-dependent RNA helicase RhlE